MRFGQLLVGAFLSGDIQDVFAQNGELVDVKLIVITGLIADTNNRNGFCRL